MFFSLLLNIGLLVLIATMLTKFSVVRRMFLEENTTLKSRMALAAIFGLVCIFSTYTGVRTDGAIVNTRVIGTMAAGLLGGPFAGVGAAVIGGIHRILFQVGDFTALPCGLATVLQGLIGAVFSRRFRQGKLKLMEIFCIVVFAEIGEMMMILLISRPFTQAWELIQVIALPMIFMNPIGMVIFMITFDRIFIEEDNEYAQKMRLALQIAEQSLPHFRRGINSVPDMQEVVRIIYESFVCTCVILTNQEKILAIWPEEQSDRFSDELVLALITPPIRSDRIENSQLQELYLKQHTIISAPLFELEKPAGNLIVVIKKYWRNPQTTVSFTEELAKLFSTQLDLANLDKQKYYRRNAELKALQSQVNPHFLYNALNTIASVSRENTDRARELILTLSSYYRQTLEREHYMEYLDEAILNVKNYLELEKARFEDKLNVEIVVDVLIDVLVPAFVLQPLVENAIRHGSDRAGNRHVKIRADQCSEGVRISVIDQGRGIAPEIINSLSHAGEKKGIGLKNVHQRLQSIYGEPWGLNFKNTSHGAEVWFVIPSAGLKEERV